MRINVYSQELTDEVTAVRKTGVGADGVEREFFGVRMILHSSAKLHNTIHDDDRSAITLWLPESSSRRQILANTLYAMAQIVENFIQ